jgi:hypothetical protein
LNKKTDQKKELKKYYTLLLYHLSSLEIYHNSTIVLALKREKKTVETIIQRKGERILAMWAEKTRKISKHL